MNTENGNGRIEPQEFRDRVGRLQGALAEVGLPGAIVVSRGASTAEEAADVIYLTNHFTHFCLIPDCPPIWVGHGYCVGVVPAEGEMTLIVCSPSYREDLVVADEIRVASDVWAELPKVLEEKGLGNGKVGLIGERIFSFRAYGALVESLPEVELVFADELLAKIRRVKSAAEIARLRNASRVGAKMMNAFMEAAVPGATEAECMAAAHAAGLPLGARPWDAPTTSGALSPHYMYHRNPAWDHTQPLQKGDLTHPDLFGTVDDYQYDFSRTKVVGAEPSEGQRALMDAAQGLVEHVVDLARPGVTAGQLAEAGQAWLAENGPKEEADDDAVDFQDLFPSFGHGIGLSWERPYIRVGEEVVLEPGMVLAVETLVGDKHGGAGFEHDVVVTEDEPEILSLAARSDW